MCARTVYIRYQNCFVLRSSCRIRACEPLLHHFFTVTVMDSKNTLHFSDQTRKQLQLTSSWISGSSLAVSSPQDPLPTWLGFLAAHESHAQPRILRGYFTFQSQILSACRGVGWKVDIFPIVHCGGLCYLGTGKFR